MLDPTFLIPLNQDLYRKVEAYLTDFRIMEQCLADASLRLSNVLNHLAADPALAKEGAKTILNSIVDDLSGSYYPLKEKHREISATIQSLWFGIRIGSGDTSQISEFMPQFQALDGAVFRKYVAILTPVGEIRHRLREGPATTDNVEKWRQAFQPVA